VVTERKPPGRAQTIDSRSLAWPNRRYLTAEETAWTIRRSLTTVYRRIRTGKLEAFRFGREWRVERL
jgi:excisionase family DNA binding protein